MGVVKWLIGNYSKKEIKRVLPLQKEILDLEDEYAELTDKELREKTDKFKERLADGETLDDILVEAYATIREAAWRVLGLKAFPVQLICGIILHQGRIAEMKTGEGKTLVAVFPAYLNALLGKGVHVVTVNEYLAKYGADLYGKVYKFLGLEVGLIIHDMNTNQRREAYLADITYGTNNELGFDYLRDNMVIYKANKVQRPHNFCIVDEVDSILIDEARTPLIISGQGEKSTDLYEHADNFARKLTSIKIKQLDSKIDEHDDHDVDYIIDEKAKTATLTPKGIKRAEADFKIINLNDAENMTLAHHINQAIKAQGIMKRDIDYVVRDGEVMIVDEFTGRIMFGRRYNEGLHQAIEAKEGVKVENESKTLATITFQNFFRLYNKLSGMTGTALTEEQEFREIYKLDVVEIPTNKPMVRFDNSDVIYKTEKGKLNAIVEQILECYDKNQPVLVGTITIEKSEELSLILKRKGIKHEVLNAKYHDKEAEIIAQAGKPGAVTIATNMAGRGTDIILGGNAEMLSIAAMRKEGFEEWLIVESQGVTETEDDLVIGAREKYKELKNNFKEEIVSQTEIVIEAGGLFVLGTERHESRRIDNQLRGRSGRQGDPGESRFFISLEDDLMRLFGGQRLQALMDRLGVDENTPLETKTISKSVEGAQHKIEERNFGIRKNVLEFDDVMNKQREVIYGQRDKVLDGDDLSEGVLKIIESNIENTCEEYLTESLPEDWNIEGLRDHYLGFLTTEEDLHYDDTDINSLKVSDVANDLNELARKKYAEKEEEVTSNIMRDIERVIMLRAVDTNWMDHIDAMDELRKGIGLRAYGQHNPVIEYRNEGFDMFDQMTKTIAEQVLKMMLTVHVKKNEEVKPEPVATITETHGASLEPSQPKTRTSKKVGRNEFCPCGSGKKYKKCHGENDDSE